MRTFPVNLFAGRADVEFVKVLFGQRLEAVEYLFLADWFQGVVTTHAAVERGDAVYQVEALDDFGQLLLRVERARTISVGDDPAHQQAPVPAEKDALVPLEDASQLRIIVISLIETIKPQHSQIGSQPPEMVIEQKTRLHRRTIWNGMHFDLVTILRDRAQLPFPTVDLHLPDLRMRHPQGLH